MQTNYLDLREVDFVDLQFIADNVMQRLADEFPEYNTICRVHRVSGCRVGELFESNRWFLDEYTNVTITAEKGSLVRKHHLTEIGLNDIQSFQLFLTDIQRLSNFIYARAFSNYLKANRLFRLSDKGFRFQSTHFFRHVKVKELFVKGLSINEIAAFIGEAKPDNVNYYINSRFFVS